MLRKVSARAVSVRALAGFGLSLTLGASSAIAGGPLMLSGHDPDDHGFTTQYAALFTAIRANVTNGGNNILAIGADPMTSAGNWITTIGALMTPPQTVTFVNNASISSVSFAGYAIIHVPSTTVDVSGGINPTTENPLLIARANDVANFINGGGGLFGLTQDQIANAYDYLGPFANVAALGVPASGDCDGGAGSALYDDVTATVLGNSLGITNSNIDGCCWHNVFTSFPPFLKVLANANEPACTIAINAVPSVIGCLQCNIPGQMNLTPTPDLNPPNSNHTVTATFLEGAAPNDPIVGALITFTVISGPNTGATGMDTTDINGEATFTYTGTGGIGLDVIQAEGVDPNTLANITSNDALKFWDEDCNANLIPDTCDVDCGAYGGACLANYPGCGSEGDANGNDVPDSCDECVTDGDCSNGVFCDGDEVCNVDQCEPGPLPDCDDGVSCTVDSCNEGTDQCDHGANDNLCQNGLFCDGDEVCDLVLDCQDGPNPNCDDGVACTVDSCNEGSDQCDHLPSNGLCANGFFCDGVEICNVMSGCLAGVPVACGDGVLCTMDLCNEATDSCDNTPNNASCANGLYCDGAEVCHPTLDCQDGADPNCADSVACTVDACVEATDSCSHTPDNDVCSDGLFCTGTETCHATLGCQNGPDPSCNDGVGCTSDVCDEMNDECDHNPNDGACADGLFCNGDETCDVLNDCEPSVNPCTGMTLCSEPLDACVNCLTNADCNNSLYCDGVETCVAGACDPGLPPSCADGIECTLDACVEATDSCSHTPDNDVCSDGDFCTGTEICNAGSGCTDGANPNCSDGVACTLDTCDEVNDECDHGPDDASCDDGQVCNGVETCDPQNDCEAGPPLDCDDGVACTLDTCDEANDECDHAPTNSACGDGQFCNGDEICIAQGMGQGCAAGLVVTCPDGDGFACTLDACDEGQDACVQATNQCVCGNGTAEPGEECDPPTTMEDCNNMADDDGDTAVDCGDSDCVPPSETCGSNCVLDDPCEVVKDDPATIVWGKDGGPDRFTVHGRFFMHSPVEPLSEGFAVRLSNVFGTIYQSDLGNGDMRGRLGGRSFKFTDKTARVDGAGARGGLYRVGLKVRPYQGIYYLTFKILAYGDFGSATVPEMTTEVVVGSNVAYLDAVWTETNRGWKLPLSDFQ